MDPEESEKLDDLYKLTEENNLMLRKIRRTQKNAQMFRALYWIIIIGTAVGAFYFVKPYFDSISGFYSSFGGENKNTASSGFKLQSSSQFQDLVNEFKQ